MSISYYFLNIFFERVSVSSSTHSPQSTFIFFSSFFQPESSSSPKCSSLAHVCVCIYLNILSLNSKTVCELIVELNLKV